MIDSHSMEEVNTSLQYITEFPNFFLFKYILVTFHTCVTVNYSGI